MRVFRFTAICLATLFSMVVTARAGVINSANVNIGGTSFRTFTDDTTSLIWLDVDNFYGNHTYNSIVAVLDGTGFHLATESDLNTLFASIPAESTVFVDVATIVGGNYFGNPYSPDDRELIWGIFEDGNSADGISYAYQYEISGVWQIGTNEISASTILSTRGFDFKDLGAWVVADQVVPEPSSIISVLSLVVFGGGGMLIRRRRASKVKT